MPKPCVLVENGEKTNPTQQIFVTIVINVTNRMVTPSEQSSLRPIRKGRALLKWKRVAARIPPLHNRLEEKIHNNVDARQRHNMANKGCEVALCTSLPLHHVAFYSYLCARER